MYILYFMNFLKILIDILNIKNVDVDYVYFDENFVLIYFFKIKYYGYIFIRYINICIGICSYCVRVKVMSE